MTTQNIWIRIDRIDWDSLPLWKFSSWADQRLNPPKIFRELVSPHEKIRQQAHQDFDNLFSHQGDILGGLYYAIPFLLELAQDANIEYKDEILGLLANYAYYTRFSYTEDGEKGQLDELYDKIYQQIDVSLEYFLQRLFLDTGKDRINIIRLLGYLPTQSETVFPKLIESFQTTVDTDELIAIFRSLSALLQDRPSLPLIFKTMYHDLLLEIINDEKHAWQLKIKSIFEYISIYKAKTSPEIEEILTNLIIKNEDGWLQNQVDNLITIVYAKFLGEQRHIDFLFTLIDGLKHKEFFIYRISNFIFYTTHILKKEKFLKLPLTNNQRRFFELVINTNLDLQLDLFPESYYFPKTKDEIRRILEEDNELKRNIR